MSSGQTPRAKDLDLPPCVLPAVYFHSLRHGGRGAVREVQHLPQARHVSSVSEVSYGYKYRVCCFDVLCYVFDLGQTEYYALRIRTYVAIEHPNALQY